jgi:hypothetical protein
MLNLFGKWCMMYQKQCQEALNECAQTRKGDCEHCEFKKDIENQTKSKE